MRCHKLAVRSALEQIWYGGRRAPWALICLSWVFGLAVALRRFAYTRGWRQSERLDVPVIIVGNICVGGSGKTPLVVWLVRHLQARGLRPGVVSRGYGGTWARWPRLVTAGSDPAEVGDEPVMLARRTLAPVAVASDRVAAGRYLVRQCGCDVLVGDDGLQHYRLMRDLEIAVIDAARGHGNGRLLPAGPLREPVERLEQVDFVVTNSLGAGAGLHSMSLQPEAAQRLGNEAKTRALSTFTAAPVHAVCGIGNPERFFATLEGAGLELRRHAFADHHHYTREDFRIAGGGPILMTEKDAVKCASLDLPDAWVVPVRAELSQRLTSDLTQALDQLLRRPESSQSTTPAHR